MNALEEVTRPNPEPARSLAPYSSTSLPSSVPPRRVVHEGAPARHPSNRGRRYPVWLGRYRRALGPLTLLSLWIAGSGSGLLDPRVLPEPWTVAETLAGLLTSGKLQAHVYTSAVRASLGLALGIAVGSGLALLSGLSRWGEAFVDGPMQIKRAIPTLALIPLLIVWFGIGEEMKVLTVALVVTIPVYINLYMGLQAIDARYRELARVLRLTYWQFVRRIALPGALSPFLLGLRLAFAGSWLALVVVEQINATSGVGYMMSLARSYGQIEIVLVGIVVYGVLGLASDAFVRLLERKLLKWRRTLAS